MAEENKTVAPKKKVFSRENILEKQQKTIDEFEHNQKELRQAIEQVANTAPGHKLLEYLFLLCGGDIDSIRRDRDGKIDMEDTLSVLGARGVWEKVRFNMSSERIKDIERHNWEDQN